MTRQGYQAEYKCKKENEERYGVGNCIKMAICGSSDYLIAYKGKIVKFIEVKETKKDTYYPSDREKKQFSELVKIGKHHHVPVELWVYFKRKAGRPAIKHVRHIYGKQKDLEETNRGTVKVSGGKGTPVNKQRNVVAQRPLSEQDEFQESKTFGVDYSELGGSGKVFRGDIRSDRASDILE